MENLAIKVSNLTIRYKNLVSYSLRNSLLKFNKTKKEDFVAVNDVSFEVPKGQILGIIGKNGSGKSTMLKALAGIFSADEGSIETFGNSVSLLAIGVGFQKELSGRENILLSGLLLGFSEKEIKQTSPHYPFYEKEIRNKVDDIIEFSGLGKFIDMPVRTYSSGMHSKLAFSITAMLETDIMLIDEVLSVGDQRFKKKSYEKMQSLIEDKTRTVVIVSHNISTLRNLCDNVMWMHDGKIMGIGEANDILNKYEAFMEAEEQ